MALKAWMDENENLYLAGEGGGSEAMTASPEEALAAANDFLGEQEDYKALTAKDIVDFRTLWVDPEAFDEESWADDQWADVDTAKEDRQYAKLGWVPVLTIEVEEI